MSNTAIGKSKNLFQFYSKLCRLKTIAFVFDYINGCDSDKRHFRYTNLEKHIYLTLGHDKTKPIEDNGILTCNNINGYFDKAH